MSTCGAYLVEGNAFWKFLPQTFVALMAPLLHRAKNYLEILVTSSLTFVYVADTLRALYLGDNDFETVPADIAKLINLQIVSKLEMILTCMNFSP